MKIKIPWAKPDFWGNESKYVEEAIKSTWISGGPFIDRIEKYFEELLEGEKALTVSNGTTAIHLAYLGLNIKPGDEIIVPGFGFLAAANVALNMSAKPVFCEVDLQTWCMDAKSIKSCITQKTRAIVVVHTYGNVCDMDDILELADSHNIPVIEDAAEAFPSSYKGQFAGSMGTIGTYSFQATKTIATGEGGLVVTRNKELYERMKLYRSHGLKREKHYWHELPGLNFRLTNMQAALGCAQLEKLDIIMRERQRVYKTYLKCLANIKGVTFQLFKPDVEKIVWAVGVRLDTSFFPQGRDSVLQQMLEIGIEIRPGFYSSSQIKYFKCPQLKTCELLAGSIVSLPSYPSLTNNEIEYICQQLISLQTY